MDAHDIQSILDPVANVQIRRMFGGYGVYLEGVFIAIGDAEALYFKCDAQSVAFFDRFGCAPFTYTKPASGKCVTLPYRALPEAAYDDDTLLREFVTHALAAARRNPQPKRKADAKKPASL